MSPTIFVTRNLPHELLEPLYSIGTVEMWKEDSPCPRSMLLDKAQEAVALFTTLSDQVNGELFQAAKRLKVVANLAVGYDNIDLEAAKNFGVTVTNTPDVLTDTTADLAFALLMATARRIVEAAEFVKKGEWSGWSPFLLAGSDIHHKTIGIVGMGKIGSAIARRAKGFEMDVLYYSRRKKPQLEKELGAIYCPFPELLEKADFVVNVAPLTDETRNLFNEQAFKKMKKTGIFVNVGRGATVDEHALYKALENGEIAGCGLDVFQEEPIGPDHPLLKFKQVVALPHIGSASKETREGMIRLCVENIKRVLTGEKPITEVVK